MLGVPQRMGSLVLAASVVLVLVLTAGLAAATGSGYNQSYSRASNTALPADVDLVSVSSTYSSGPNLTVSLSVAGTVVTNDDNYSYAFWFGGSWSGNATAAIGIGSPTLTAQSLASLTTYSGGTFHAQPSIPFHVSGGTLSVSVATAIVGPASSFAVNVVASHYAPQEPSSTNWLGTGFATPCTGSGCSAGGTGTGGASSSIPIGEILWPVVIVAVVVVVVVLLVRRRGRQKAARGVVPAPAAPVPPPPKA